MKESEFQVELNDLRARSKQQIHIGESGMQIIPPALFTNEMLDQIRAVVREEVQALRKSIAEDVKQSIARDVRLNGSRKIG